MLDTLVNTIVILAYIKCMLLCIPLRTTTSIPEAYSEGFQIPKMEYFAEKVKG